MAPTFREYDLWKDSNSKKSVSYQKKDGRGHARPSFFWYDNDKDLKVCFPVTHVRCSFYLIGQKLSRMSISNQDNGPSLFFMAFFVHLMKPEECILQLSWNEKITIEKADWVHLLDFNS